MDDSSQAPSAAGFFPGKFTQGDRDGRHEASGIRNMTAIGVPGKTAQFEQKNHENKDGNYGIQTTQPYSKSK